MITIALDYAAAATSVAASDDPELQRTQRDIDRLEYEGQDIDNEEEADLDEQDAGETLLSQPESTSALRVVLTGYHSPDRADVAAAAVQRVQLNRRKGGLSAQRQMMKAFRVSRLMSRLKFVLFHDAGRRRFFITCSRPQIRFKTAWWTLVFSCWLSNGKRSASNSRPVELSEQPLSWVR